MLRNTSTILISKWIESIVQSEIGKLTCFTSRLIWIMLLTQAKLIIRTRIPPLVKKNCQNLLGIQNISAFVTALGKCEIEYESTSDMLDLNSLT